MIKNGYMMMQPIYPLLIQQFIDDYNLSEGIAVDIGAGPGYMGMELAKATNMQIHVVDISDEALKKAKMNYDDINADNEIFFVKANVETLPFPDSFADFTMSRGSIWFWEKPEEGLKEIYRILKPGGIAVVGGGLGRYMPKTMRDRLYASMKEGVTERKEKRPSLAEYEEIVKKANLKNYRIFTDGDEKSGKWVEIRK